MMIITFDFGVDGAFAPVSAGFVRLVDLLQGTGSMGLLLIGSHYLFDNLIKHLNNVKSRISQKARVCVVFVIIQPCDFSHNAQSSAIPCFDSKKLKNILLTTNNKNNLFIKQ